MNLLTDKTLIAFEKWTADAHDICSDYEHVAFFDLPEVCQYALYQEFFDSRRLFIAIRTDIMEFGWEVNEWVNEDLCRCLDDSHGCETRSLALKAAILASDGIFNNHAANPPKQHNNSQPIAGA